MACPPVILLHGYGVRGRTWDEMRGAMEGRFRDSIAPDLDAVSIDQLVDRATEEVRTFSEARAAPVVVMGHSLGAVLAAIAAHRLGTSVVAATVLLAPPFGNGNNGPDGLLRFLLKHRLIPPWMIRPRFFSRNTPKPVQKRIFKEAVPEHPDLQAATLDRPWFHTSIFDTPLDMPTLIIASKSDRIVPYSQSEAFARAIGATLHGIPADRLVGHDDLFASRSMVAEVVDTVVEFLSCG
jgi:pimeloyl-ACP methyl ester carboxylesterase